MKLSFIVPVYNARLYLSRCLDSLLDQSINDFEIICINDGSTDDSLDILREYEKKFPEIKSFDAKKSWNRSYKKYCVKNC